MAYDTEAATYPRTQAVRSALAAAQDSRTIADLLFLETWVEGRPADLAATLRASQIRRANPALATAIQQELAVR